MSKALTISLVAVLALGAAAGGYYYFMERNELSESFCTALADQAAYEEHNEKHNEFIVAGRDKWVFRTKNDFRKDWDINDKTLSYLTAMQEGLSRRNAELIIVMPPVRGMIHRDKVFRRDRKRLGVANEDQVWNSYESMLNKLQEEGIHIVGVRRDEITPNFFYSRNHHWSAEGAAVAARKVAALAAKLDVYARIPEIRYKTAQNGQIEYASSFAEVFKKMCDTELPPETAVQYETQPVSTAAGAEALFDEKAEPQIVLLGTSNSVAETSSANFDGFLREYMGRDVLNYSYVGGGVDTSLLSYLNSDHFHNGAPKILIWEVPGYYDLNIMDDKIFNQVVPAAYGSCERNPVAQVAIQTLPESGKVTLFENGLGENGAQKVSTMGGGAGQITALPGSLKDKYVHLKFSKPVTEKFNLQFSYAEGGTKIQNFSRSERFPADGSYFTTFPGVSDKKLLDIVMSVPENAGDVGVEALICDMPEA